MNEIDIEEVENALSNVHERLSCGEAVLAIPRRQTVDVVDVHVQRIRGPDPVQVPTEHAAWSQENVANVPSHDKTAKEQPC